MKKFILTTALAIAATFAFTGAPVSAATTADDTATIMAELEDEIANGTFDSESLTDAERTAIWETYNYDPEAISELQRQSDDNNASLSSISTKGYTHSSAYDDYDIINGIDVSKWQATIDWEKVKADGVDFVFIRVAYAALADGSLNTDPMYQTNIEGALAAGLDVGVYIYSQATSTSEAKKEAKYALKLIADYDINLPVVMDYEYGGAGTYLQSASLTKAKRAKICNAFCDYVEESGYTAMVYANYSMLTSDINTSSVDCSYPIWIARYNTSTGYTASYDYWQYSSSGSVKGISGSVDMNVRYIKDPDKVTNLECNEATISTITLTWDKIVGVYGYRIYKLNEETGEFDLLATNVGASSTEYIDTDLNPAETYSYKVRAYYKLTDGNYNGSYSSVLEAQPNEYVVDTGIAITGSTDSTISLTWDVQAEAGKYVIYRYNSDTDKYEKVKTINKISTNTYTDKSLKCGTNYSYKLKVYFNGTAYEDPTIVTQATLPGQVSGLTYSATKSSITLSWDAQVGVNGYRVYVMKNGKWKKIKTIKKATTNTYTYKKLKTNTQYKFSVIAYYKKSGKTVTTTRSNTLTAVTASKKVSGFKATAKTKSSVKLTWNKASNVTGYIIYRKDLTDGGDYKKIKTISKSTTLTYTATGLTSTHKYKFKIVAYRSSGGVKVEGAATTKSITIAPSAVKNVTGTAYDSGYLLTWDAMTSAGGYIIYSYDMETGKSTKVATVTSGDANSYVVDQAVTETFTYFVKAYVVLNKKKVSGVASDYATESTSTQKATVNVDKVNVRKKASTSGKIVTTAKKKQTVTILDVVTNDSGTWYYVTYKKSGTTYTGYISATYLTLK